MIGSTVAFAALHASMLKKGVIAVCRFTRNASAAPRFCYLVPQLEVIDPDTQAQVLTITTSISATINSHWHECCCYFVFVALPARLQLVILAETLHTAANVTVYSGCLGSAAIKQPLAVHCIACMRSLSAKNATLCLTINRIISLWCRTWQYKMLLQVFFYIYGGVSL
jgi:Ku70/Ku80 beta-barrel domain